MRVECSSVRNVRRMWLLDPKGGGGGLGEDDFRLLDFCERFFFLPFFLSRSVLSCGKKKSLLLLLLLLLQSLLLLLVFFCFFLTSF